MRRNIPLIFLDVLVALTAVTGGVVLIAQPHGAGSWLPVTMLDPTPFTTFFIPGLLLLTAVGGGALTATLAEILGRRRAPLLSAGAGGVLLGWMIGEITLLRTFEPLQIFYLVVALAQITLGIRALGAERAEGPGDDRALAFLTHHRLAFVGLSSDPKDFSSMVAEALRQQGHEVIPVNPKAAAAGAAGVFARVSDIPDPPGAALLMVPPAAAEGVVKDCAAAGVEAVWFHRGAGPGSASPEAIAAARAAKMSVVQGVCPMMYIQPVGWLHRAHHNLAHVA